jgi:hypothetical protein
LRWSWRCSVCSLRSLSAESSSTIRRWIRCINVSKGSLQLAPFFHDNKIFLILNICIRTSIRKLTKLILQIFYKLSNIFSFIGFLLKVNTSSTGW